MALSAKPRPQCFRLTFAKRGELWVSDHGEVVEEAQVRAWVVLALAMPGEAQQLAVQLHRHAPQLGLVQLRPSSIVTRRADGAGGKVKPVAASAKFGTRLNPTMGHSQRAKSRYGIPKAYLVPSTAVRQSIVAALEKACSTWVRGQNIKPMPVNDPSWVYVSPDGKTDPRPYRFVKQELPQGGYYLYCPSTYPPSEVDGSHYYALTTTELRDAFLEDSAFQEHNAVTKKQLLDVKNRRKRDNVPTIEMRMKIERYTAGRNAREMAQAAIGATEKQVQQQQLEQEIQMLKAAIAARQQQLEQQAQTSVAMAVGGD